jgi:hypothetical protein
VQDGIPNSVMATGRPSAWTRASQLSDVSPYQWRPTMQSGHAAIRRRQVCGEILRLVSVDGVDAARHDVPGEAGRAQRVVRDADERAKLLRRHAGEIPLVPQLDAPDRREIRPLQVRREGSRQRDVGVLDQQQHFDARA